MAATVHVPEDVAPAKRAPDRVVRRRRSSPSTGRCPTARPGPVVRWPRPARRSCIRSRIRLVMAGQGTAALELHEQVGSLDVLLVPMSGGGLMAGCASAMHQLDPDCELIGVEPAAADDTRRSFAAGDVGSHRPTRHDRRRSGRHRARCCHLRDQPPAGERRRDRHRRHNSSTPCASPATCSVAVSSPAASPALAAVLDDPLALPGPSRRHHPVRRQHRRRPLRRPPRPLTAIACRRHGGSDPGRVDLDAEARAAAGVRRR